MYRYTKWVRVRIGGFEMGRKIAVLIADIISSREIENRERVQDNLEMILDRLTEDEDRGLISSPSITRGDEFELAFEDASKCFKTFREIEREFYPNKLSGGLGFGELDTGVRESTSEMDGPAFHRARNALEDTINAKEKPVFLIRCDDEDFTETLNSFFHLLYSVKNDWTKREREFAEYYLSRKGEVTHEKIGKHFEVGRSSVSRTLLRAHISAVEKAEEFISMKLSELGGR